MTDNKARKLLLLHRDLTRARMNLDIGIKRIEDELKCIQASGNTPEAEIVPSDAVSGR